MPSRKERAVNTARDPGPESTVDQGVFREIMSGFPAGVTVVTAYNENGDARGLTVSAFCSVSLSPPLVLVCVDKGSDTLPAIQAADAYTVNFLAADHEELAMRFASKSADKFDGLSHGPPEHSGGGPILDEDCSAYVVCKVWKALEAGDHWVFVGRVEDGAVNEGPAPLVYGEKKFAGWRPAEKAAP